MNVSTISARLAGVTTRQVRFLDQIDSTNDEALRWASEGATNGCLVIADQQTSGRGRLGRRWVTTPGAGLAFSVVIIPTTSEKNQVSLFTGLAALAVCQAVEELAGIPAQIKWPNDILLQRKKAGGILVEATWMGVNLQHLVIGIGINVSLQSVPPPEELLFPATSIEEVAGKKVDRLDLLCEIVQRIDHWRAAFHEDSFLNAWEERIAFKGEWVGIENATNPAGEEKISGQIAGLDRSGGLILRTAAGRHLTVTAGDLTLRLIPEKEN